MFVDIYKGIDGKIPDISRHILSTPIRAPAFAIMINAGSWYVPCRLLLIFILIRPASLGRRPFGAIVFRITLGSFHVGPVPQSAQAENPPRYSGSGWEEHHMVSICLMSYKLFFWEWFSHLCQAFYMWRNRKEKRTLLTLLLLPRSLILLSFSLSAGELYTHDSMMVLSGKTEEKQTRLSFFPSLHSSIKRFHIGMLRFAKKILCDQHAAIKSMYWRHVCKFLWVHIVHWLAQKSLTGAEELVKLPVYFMVITQIPAFWICVPGQYSTHFPLGTG